MPESTENFSSIVDDNGLLTDGSSAASFDSSLLNSVLLIGIFVFVILIFVRSYKS